MGEVRPERERASYTGGTLARNTRGVWGVVCHKCDKWIKKEEWQPHRRRCPAQPRARPEPGLHGAARSYIVGRIRKGWGTESIMEGLSNFPDEIFLEDVEQLRKEYANAQWPRRPEAHPRDSHGNLDAWAQAAASSAGQCPAGPPNKKYRRTEKDDDKPQTVEARCVDYPEVDFTR